MSKEYFIVVKNKKEGPLTIKQLKGKLYPDTLIWFDGLDNWLKAKDVQEVRAIITNRPPPIPKKVYKPNKFDRWIDKHFTKKNVLKGVFVFFLSLFFIISVEIYESYPSWEDYSIHQLSSNKPYDGLLYFFFFKRGLLIPWDWYILEAIFVVIIYFILRWYLIKYPSNQLNS